MSIEKIELKKINVLFADDDADDRNLFKKALEELPLGTTLTMFPDGEQLMKHLSENPNALPHVIFLDINMPRKTGPECLIEIKKNEKMKDIPVIMFSTSNDWDTINTLFTSGAHVYIHKPSDFAQLKQVIHHALPIAAEKIFSSSSLNYVLNA